MINNYLVGPRKWLKNIAPVAQLDRVGGFEPLGREFESLRVRHSLIHKALQALLIPDSFGSDEERQTNSNSAKKKEISENKITIGFHMPLRNKMHKKI